MIKIKENMTFSEVLEHLKEGKCVRRANWNCNRFFTIQIPKKQLFLTKTKEISKKYERKFVSLKK